ncbi:two-component system, cell cycle sensor histidine kinase PleC [Phyllobacterium sp. CL33Tsu]|uniref:sensor histidine kinase n=1 Tax=Phyllobacterium sp. CL33Tsu TaxID=1798191 RepID=UPI0008F057D3|nr:HAMP domain-containing sensor histidine kinase [Phyllobacterium sp. CL33Tsu]SFI98718.1 two-component system, cell cycle sensor histidine kinase PleC [Phyllobacterium sp. CL33Tsu]
MASLDAISADKNIVDRRKLPRNKDLSAVMRGARDQLMERAGGNHLERELLFMHTRALIVNTATFPLLIVMIAGVGVFSGFGGSIIVWALVTMGLYMLLGLLARRLAKRGIANRHVHKWQMIFLGGHFMTSIGWAYFAVLDCAPCGISYYPVVKAVVIILAMAITAIVTSALRASILAAFTLPVVAYTLLAAKQLGSPLSAIMVVMLFAGLIFFYLVALRLNQSVAITLALQAEKDALIAELETANAMSDEGRRRAEEANLAKSRFLASMSHELRTPLNAILGFSEVMAKEVLGPIENGTYREYASDIHASGEHLLNLINEILDLSRIEAGRYTINEEPLLLADIANECIHMMKLKARNKDITIVPQFEKGMLRIKADERSIRQIVLNLMANAIKFTPTGGRVHIKVGWTAGGGQYLTIRDNGPGIPPEEIPVVLSTFGQGSIAIKNAEQGTGLGLPIVQALVNLHDGQFHLFSKLREGTEALATFPRSRVIADEARRRGALHRKAA